MAMEPGAAEPQAKRVPVDHADRLVGHERVSDKESHERPARERPALQVEAGVKEKTLGLLLVDRDSQPRRLVADVNLVAATHLDERRDVEILGHRGPEARAIRPWPKRVEMSFAVGVVDLHDDHAEDVLAVAAQIEARGI